MTAHARKLAPALAPRPTLIALAALTVLASMGNAQAQTQSLDAEKAKQQLDTVTVTGFRAALESALIKKRDDNGIVDVIKAEDIAKFPDTNLAESMQRVPGVVIDRDAGEGKNITVRGLGSDFTRVRINGIEALATTGATDSSGANNRGRGFDFNVFASELFNQITVRKSSSADVDEGSLGATVDLSTSHPFDFKGLVTTVSVKERYNDLSKKTDPRAAFLVSNTFFNNKVGVLLSGAYTKRRLYEEGFGSVRFDNGPSSGGWCAPGTGLCGTGGSASVPGSLAPAKLPVNAANTAAYNAANDVNNFHPRLPRYGRLTHDQDRIGLTGSIQLKPDDKTLITLDVLYAKLKATREEDWLEAISFSRTAAQGGKPQTSVVSASYDANGSLISGTYNGVDIRAESRFDKLSTTFVQPTLKISRELTDRLSANLLMGRATSGFRNPMQTTTTLDALNVNGYSIDFSGNRKLPVITYPFDTTGGTLALQGVPVATSGTQAATVTNTTTSEIRIRPQGTTNQNSIADLDLAWEVNDNVTLRGGVDYKKYKFDTYEFRRVNQNDTIFAPAGGMAGLTKVLTGFGSQLGLSGGTPTSWVIPDFDAIAKAYDIYCNCIKSGPSGGPGDFTLTSTTNGNARGNNSAVTETDTGWFAMTDFNGRVAGMKVRGNFGVRYVTTKEETTGYLATGGGTQVNVGNTYKDWLPSLNLAMNLRNDLILRFAAAKVMSRPMLANLNPGGSIATTGTLSITSGNPLLKPYRAKTFDESLEWYVDKDTFVGIGLFQKKIDSYIQTLRVNVPYNTTGFPMSLLPSNFTGTEVFQVQTAVNTEGGNLTGFELNWQQPFNFLPGWGKNFGMLLNYTKVQSKIKYQVSPTGAATITDDLLNLSPKSSNATLYYDDGTLSARVSLSKRGSFLTRVPGQNNNDVEGKNPTKNVDASITYKVNNKLDISLEGVNLTNQAQDQFISRQRNSPVVYTVTGREYLIGARYKF